MTTKIDLKQIEERTRASYYEDGFVDITVGLVVLSMSLFFSLQVSDSRGAFWWFLLLFLVAWVAPAIARRYITYSRTGQVKLRSPLSGNHRRILFFVTCFVIGLASVNVGVAASYDLIEIPEIAGGILIGIGWMLVFGPVGYFGRYRLMYAYGFLIAVSWALDRSMDNMAGEVMMYASSALMIVIGLARTIVFLRKYPKASVEDVDANRPS